MKTGHILSIIITTILVMTVLMLTSCSSNVEEVKLEVSEKKIIDFDKYDKIIYADLLLKATPEGFNPSEELFEFFINDLSKVLEKKVQHFDVSTIADINSVIDENIRLRKIEERLKGVPNSLLITGILTFDIKTRTKIKDVKNDSGKKEKTFVKVQHWGLTMKILIIDLNTEQELFNKNYSEKTANADVLNPKYNFDDLFFKISNNFTRDLVNKKSTQRRYLLTN